MQILYPDIKAYAKHKLTVDNIHTLHIEECGSPGGLPVLFVHGGPGAGCGPSDRRFFDPDKYRIILYDQRGAGKSTPHACLENNTTDHLINDIETIREHLNIDQWVLFGGSWGSTLSLLYAEKYPQNVLGLILRGIFLCREQDFHWFYQHGAGRIFPDYWQNYLEPIPEAERADMISAYHTRLTGPNELAKMAAAKAWASWEAHCATLRPNSDVINRFTEPHMALALSRIEAHYFINKAFIKPNQIIDQAAALEGIPGIIIHGRYDAICPLDNAMALRNVWPDAQLQIIRDAGHSSHEPSIVDALVRATNMMAAMVHGDKDKLS